MFLYTILHHCSQGHVGIHSTENVVMDLYPQNTSAQKYTKGQSMVLQVYT